MEKALVISTFAICATLLAIFEKDGAGLFIVFLIITAIFMD